ncbi:MAG: DUF885 family protein, partial [Gammaproteobacteria bacterium]
MRLLGKLFGGLVILLLVGLAGAASWFWFFPVTVNNTINQFTAELALETPEMLTGIGLIDNTPLDFHSGKLGDYTREHELQQIEKLKAARARLDRFDPADLDAQEKLSLEITGWFLDDMIRQASFERSGYRVNQISGVTVDLPQFLTDMHQVKSAKSAERYVSRLREFGRVLEESRARVEADRAAGVTPPDFIIAKAVTVMRNFIDKGPEGSALVTTLPAKLESIEGLDEADR